jgi:hypothetical protein
MQITLDSSEIKQAIISYVKDQGIDLTNTTVVVGMTAGRGSNGTTATVDIIPKGKTTTANSGVKNTFHTVSNLAPRAISEQEEEEEVLIDETPEPVLEDIVEEEELEEEEAAPATNSIFK